MAVMGTDAQRRAVSLQCAAAQTIVRRLPTPLQSLCGSTARSEVPAAPHKTNWRGVRQLRMVRAMLTVIETPTFAADARELWSEEERGAFCAWIAANSEAGDVIAGSGGCRKVR